MKRNIFVSLLGICICVVLSTCCVGCDRIAGSNLVSDTSTLQEGVNNSVSYNNLPYSIRSKMSLAFTLDLVKNELLGIDSTKDEPDNMYTKFLMDDESFVFVFYKEDKNVEFIWRAKQLPASESLSSLKAGDTLKNVQEIDEYTSVFDNGNETGISEHRCLNGDLITILYDHSNDEWVVSSIETSSDPYEFIQKITVQDKELLGIE